MFHTPTSEEGSDGRGDDSHQTLPAIETDIEAPPNELSDHEGFETADEDEGTTSEVPENSPTPNMPVNGIADKTSHKSQIPVTTSPNLRRSQRLIRKPKRYEL
jgi:hypothetical protein